MGHHQSERFSGDRHLTLSSSARWTEHTDHKPMARFSSPSCCRPPWRQPSVLRCVPANPGVAAYPTRDPHLCWSLRARSVRTPCHALRSRSARS